MTWKTAVHLLVLNGDGIGPEIARATMEMRTVDAAFDLAFEHEIGLAALSASGATFPEVVFEAAKRADGVMLRPVSHNPPPSAPGRAS